MTKYCSDCSCLNTSKEKKGKENCFLCERKRSYVYPCDSSCEFYKNNWKSSFEKEELFNKGKKSKNASSDIPIPAVLFLFFFLIVIYIIAKINGY